MAHAGTIHKFTPRLFAFERAAAKSSTGDSPNTILWIGGLGDGLITVEYTTKIAEALPADWVFADVILASAYKGWGVGSLKRDARELGECVKYFQKLRPGKKVVLMGHSTGCQDIMEYLVGEAHSTRPSIDGAILQGGVSDREAWEDMTDSEGTRPQLNALIQTAKEWIDSGKGKEVLPSKGNFVAEILGAPMSADRTYSLLAKGGADDYFSNDLPDSVLEGTFGKFPKATRAMFLLGSKDPYVPASIDRAALIQRWTNIIRQGGGVVDDKNGGVVEGAHHNLNDDPEEVVADLVNRVVEFLKGLREGDARL